LSFASPGNGKSVSGTIEILLDAKSRGGVNPYVTFYVDKQFKTLKNYPPYSYAWDSTTVENGYHTIEASGYLDSGNITTTRRLKVFVDNPGGATVRRNDVPDLSRAREAAPVSAATATAKALTIPLPKKSVASVKPVGKTAVPRISASVARPSVAALGAATPAPVASATFTRAPSATATVAMPAVTADKFTVRGEAVASAATQAFAQLRAVSAAAEVAPIAAAPVAAIKLTTPRAPRPTFAPSVAPSVVVAPSNAAPTLAAPRNAKPAVATRSAAVANTASALAPAANAAPLAIRSATGRKLPGSTLIAPSPARPTPTTIIVGKRSVATVSIAKPGAPPRFVPVLPIEKAPVRRSSQAAPRVAWRAVAPGTRFSERKGAVQVAFDGERIAFDVQPRIAAGMPVAPFRQIFEHTGGRVEWAAQTRTVRAVNADREVVFAMGKKTARVNGETLSMARPAQLEKGRAVVPLSFVGKALDVNVQYDPATGRLQITSKK